MNLVSSVFQTENYMFWLDTKQVRPIKGSNGHFETFYYWMKGR